VNVMGQGLAVVLLVQPKIGAVGVYSFLGDGVDVTSADEAPRDTRIEWTSRETLDHKNIGFHLDTIHTIRRPIPGTSCRSKRRSRCCATGSTWA